MEPMEPKSDREPHLTGIRPQPRSRLDPTALRGQGPYTQPPKAAKSKGKWLPILAIATVLGAGGVVLQHYTTNRSNPTPISGVATDAQQTLTLSGADLDEAATAQAIAAIQSGQDDDVLIAKLTQKQKQEIVAGQRKFYKLPIVVPTQAARHDPSTPGAQPQTAAQSTASQEPAGPTQPAAPTARHTSLQQPIKVQPRLAQPTSQARPKDQGPQDLIQLVLNGVVYGRYNVTDHPLTLDAPLTRGDVISLACLELSPGKSSVTVGIANVLSPVQTTLSLGQNTSWFVGTGGSNTGSNYDWFETQARNGNPVAEYGLAHMYQYGIGVSQDKNQAIHWYQQAANQNYRDAKQRLAELGQ